jgi:hypothetical protein
MNISNHLSYRHFATTAVFFTNVTRSYLNGPKISIGTMSPSVGLAKSAISLPFLHLNVLLSFNDLLHAIYFFTSLKII